MNKLQDKSRLLVGQCCHAKYDSVGDILNHLRYFHEIEITDVASGCLLRDRLQELFDLGIIRVALALHMPTKTLKPIFIIGTPS